MDEDMLDKAKDVAGQVVEKADKAVDAAKPLTDKIPGEADDAAVEKADGLIDKAKDMLKGS